MPACQFKLGHLIYSFLFFTLFFRVQSIAAIFSFLCVFTISFSIGFFFLPFFTFFLFFRSEITLVQLFAFLDRQPFFFLLFIQASQIRSYLFTHRALGFLFALFVFYFLSFDFSSFFFSPLFYDSLFSFEAFYAPLLRQQILDDVYRHPVNWLVNSLRSGKGGPILCDKNVVKCSRRKW